VGGAWNADNRHIRRWRRIHLVRWRTISDCS
jgi:hypothetical protein